MYDPNTPSVHPHFPTHLTVPPPSPYASYLCHCARCHATWEDTCLHRADLELRLRYRTHCPINHHEVLPGDLTIIEHLTQPA